MTQRLLYPVLIMLLPVLLFSCSDKEKEKTNVEPEKPSNTFLLLGTWNVLFFADDDNENGVLDEDEKVAPEADEKLTIYFQSDGTGETISEFEETPGSPREEREKFKWEFQNNETQLRVISEYTDSFNSQVRTIYDTAVVDILALSDVATTWQFSDYYFDGVDSIDLKSWIILGKQK
ncbi:MAG TPA: hypothetical protein VIN07_11080 [Flavipsychrobacter sp.]